MCVRIEALLDDKLGLLERLRVDGTEGYDLLIAIQAICCLDSEDGAIGFFGVLQGALTVAELFVQVGNHQAYRLDIGLFCL